MKVFLFCNQFPQSYEDAFVSGIVKNAFNQAKSLRKLGCEVSVITDEKPKGEWQIEGIEVVSVGHGIGKGVFKAAYLDILFTIKAFRMGITKADIIHIHTGNLLFIFILKSFGLFKNPIVYTAHGTLTPELKANFSKKLSVKERLVKMNGWAQEKIDSFMWKHSDLLISVSEFQCEEMRKIYKVGEEKIVSIYNGVDLSMYQKRPLNITDFRRELNLSENRKNVLFVGRLARKKGVHLLLDALPYVIKKLPDTHFILVLGEMHRSFDKEYRNEILSRIQNTQYASNLSVFENVSEYELPMFYQVADLCVFPSLEYESLPTVIFEAMATGVPVITQGSWGTPEVIKEMLVSEDVLLDSIQLSSHIINLLENKERRDIISQEYKSIIVKFDWLKLGKKYCNLYEELKGEK